MSAITLKSLNNCSVLAAHMKRLRSIMSDVSMLTDIKSIDAGLRSMDKEDFNCKNMPEEFFKLNIYEKGFSKIAKKYSIPSQLHYEAVAALEMSATMYVGYQSQKEFQSQVGGVVEHLGKVKAAAEKLENLLELGRDDWRFIFDNFPILDKTDIDIDVLLDGTLDNLSQLKDLQGQFSNFKLIKLSGYGKKAPLGNSGLGPWTQIHLYIWLDVLERTLTNPNDGINGRVHLFSFMCDCMELIHPALEYGTIDNMLRKVQSGFKNGTEQLSQK